LRGEDEESPIRFLGPGPVATILLNRPEAINALSLRMLQLLLSGLPSTPDAEDGYAGYELRGAGTRGLCAGADVRELRGTVLAGGDVRGFFETEYSLDLAIASLGKPFTAHMSGITMGGGLGLSAHCRDRVVDATSVLAMPETQIGLFPDVFVSHILARMPGRVGYHLALTGASVNAADAIRLGLADRCAGPLPEPDAALAGTWIEECYSAGAPVEIVGRLGQHADPAARMAAAEISRRSPLAVAVSVEALGRAAGFATIADQYDHEVALAVRMATGPDFAEGVRAQLVDRDRNPHWAHADVADVTRAEVLSYFEPL
jgi:enoyl-CoA hydratase